MNKAIRSVVWAIFAILLMSVLAGSAMKPRHVKTKLNAIVRLNLVDPATGDVHNFCSGTVISDTMILTAAHCVEGLPPFMLIDIRNDDRVAKGVYATPIAWNGRADVALLQGDFRQFAHIRMAKGPMRIMDMFLDNTRETITCGYPWGSDLSCSKITDKRFVLFALGVPGVGAKGWLMPGMSGGPVIDTQTGEIVGVNTGMETDYLFFATVSGISDMLHVSKDLL